MKMWYISHPYTGNEEQNKKEAREIAAKLKKENPNVIVVNPLDFFTYAENLEYEEILQQCLEMLRQCDAIVMTGKWQYSRGCIAEAEEAAAVGIPIIFSGDFDIRRSFSAVRRMEKALEDAKKWKKAGIIAFNYALLCTVLLVAGAIW